MLPKIAFQTFFVKLPLSGKELECRSYLVKEDRILLMAAQSEDVKQVAAATRQIMNACVLEPNFDAINLSNIDADFLLLSLRAKSVGEKVVQNFTCQAAKDEKPCNTPFEITIDLRDAKLDGEVEKTKTIEITKGVGIKLKPTSFESTLNYNPNDSEIDQDIASIYYSLESVYTDETVFTRKDVTFEEFKTWILDLDRVSFKKILDYVSNMPDLVIEKTHKCVNCGTEHHIKMDSLMDFFV